MQGVILLDSLVNMIITGLEQSNYYDVFTFGARCLVYVSVIVIICLLFSVFKHLSDALN